MTHVTFSNNSILAPLDIRMKKIDTVLQNLAKQENGMLGIKNAYSFKVKNQV